MTRKKAKRRSPLIGDPVISRNLKIALEREHMSPAELARRLKLTPQAVSQWLGAQTTPGAKRLREIAEALRVTVEFLRQTPTSGQTTPARDRPLLHLRSYRVGESDHQSLPADEWLVPAHWFRRIASDQPDLAIMSVTGRDLEPELEPGDLILADRNWQVVSVAGIYLTGDRLFPVLRRCELIAGTPNRLRIHEGDKKRELSPDDLPIFGRIICKLLVPL